MDAQLGFSVFTKFFVDELETFADRSNGSSVLALSQVTENVARQVRAYTGNAQIPALYTSQYTPTGQFTFQAEPKSRSLPPPTLTTKAAPWPPDATEGGLFIVTHADAEREIANLVLPKGFTMRLDSTVERVKWKVHDIFLGEGTTIDLSADPLVPAPAQDGSNRTGQPPWGVPGVPGGDGFPGQGGKPGRAFELTVTGAIRGPGTLWIRTDGAPGGAGGRGGNGQLGGGSSCGNLREPHTNGGPGGPGGKGGIGGRGGDTGVVIVTGAAISHGCQDHCGASSRPADPTATKIAVWGAPGCGGTGGPGGAAGPGGDRSRMRECLILGTVSGGPDGNPGTPGQPGDTGACHN